MEWNDVSEWSLFHTSRPVELPGMEYETWQCSSVMVGLGIATSDRERE